MKKSNFILLVIIPLLLSGCSLLEPFSLVSTSSSNSTIDSITPGDSSSDDSNTQSSNDDSTTNSTSSGEINYEEKTYTYQKVDETIGLTKIESSSSLSTSSTMLQFSSSDSVITSSYGNGNYSNTYDDSNQITKNGYTFEIYRAVKASSSFLKLNSSIEGDSDSYGYDGAFYNVSPLNIKSISLTYTSASTDSYIFFGDTVTMNSYAVLNKATSKSTLYFNINNASYFRITSGSSSLTINSLKLYYSLTSSSYTPQTQTSYRIKQVKFNGTLESGVSKVSIPLGSTVNGKFKQDGIRTLTFYDQTEVINENIAPSFCSYTDPFDVASYVLAFGEAPVNFYFKGDSSIKDYFGDYARQKSYYTRTDGYVNAIDGIDGTKGYTEYDIYYPNQSIRGVGRVVVFNNGPYSNETLATYTDDHYATFQEYSGYGFNYRFDVQTHRTGYKWSSATLIN